MSIVRSFGPKDRNGLSSSSMIPRNTHEVTTVHCPFTAVMTRLSSKNCRNIARASRGLNRARKAPANYRQTAATPQERRARCEARARGDQNEARRELGRGRRCVRTVCFINNTRMRAKPTLY